VKLKELGQTSGKLHIDNLAQFGYDRGQIPQGLP